MNDSIMLLNDVTSDTQTEDCRTNNCLLVYSSAMHCFGLLGSLVAIFPSCSLEVSRLSCTLETFVSSSIVTESTGSGGVGLAVDWSLSTEK